MRLGSNAKITLLPKPALSSLVTTGPQAYQKYLQSRDTPSGKSTQLYFDVADYLFQNGKPTEGRRVLTSLAELDLKNPQLLRLIAFKLAELGDEYNELILEVLKQVKKLRPEEPQSFLILAYALVNHAIRLMHQPIEDGVDKESSPKELAQKHFVEALGLIDQVIMGKWDVRFSQIEATAITELNRVTNYVRFYGFDTTHHALHGIDNRLLSPVGVDLRVVILWDTDMTDVELHVEEPSGEKCFSFHNKTSNGGMLSRDFSHGYGPEEYLIRTAEEGTYTISVRLFSALSKATGTTISVRIWSYYGNPQKEQEQRYTLRLQQDRELHQVAKVVFSSSYV